MQKQKFPDHGDTLSRRRFAGGAILSAAATFFPASRVAEAQHAGEPGAETGTRPEGLSVADWDEVRARYANLLRVYGERLSAEEKGHALRILTTNQHMLASIRTFVVQNGDASACTLRLCGPKETATAGEHA